MDYPEYIYSFRRYSWSLECIHASITTCKYIVLTCNSHTVECVSNASQLCMLGVCILYACVCTYVHANLYECVCRIHPAIYTLAIRPLQENSFFIDLKNTCGRAVHYPL